MKFMDIVDALSKIKKLEREIENLKKQINKYKNEIKLYKDLEDKLLDEFDRLSKLLAKHMPFEDYDEIIVKK